MSRGWKSVLRIDPLPSLLAWNDPALTWYVRRDLLDEHVEAVEMLWELLPVKRLIHKQQEDGSWPYPGKSFDPRSNANYDLLETYRTLRLLVEMYGHKREHPALQKAAEYCFSCQTSEGDFRGIIGNQYMPYYHGAILELLIKAGYDGDSRLEKGLQWLLAMRQQDGGWLVPAQLIPPREKNYSLWHAQPIAPDHSKPHAHLATGMVLRAFAAHLAYKHHPDVLLAGERLKERFFHPDRYNDRKAASYWLKFQYPYWWTSLLTSLDTLFWLGFDGKDIHIRQGLDWFVGNQSPDGLWETGYGIGKRSAENRIWVALAICRTLKHYFEKE